MAEAVDLDPREYRGTYKLIGGRPALDFANLVSYRGTPRAHDWLDPVTNLGRWLRAARIDAGTDDPGALLDLREALATVFLAIADGRDPSGPSFDLVAAGAGRARARQQLRWRAGDRASWVLPHPQLAEVLALDAADIMTDADARARIGACDECRWVFLDTTRNRSRRWCDPADCGNRARQRRHYHRR